uniref:Uncharacterized protein n=1 Tax=Oryza meridionalis TaxID=40149 RepID=A0A0E0E6V6_9ORYZ
MAAAARRALWYGGVSPKARHMNSGRGRGLDISEPNGPLDSYIRKLMDAGNLEEINRIGKILSKRDMVKQSSESLIFERKKKMDTHNMQDMWKVAGITSSAFLFGTAFISLFAGSLHGEEEEDGILQDKKRLGLEE